MWPFLKKMWPILKKMWPFLNKMWPILKKMWTFQMATFWYVVDPMIIRHVRTFYRFDMSALFVDYSTCSHSGKIGYYSTLWNPSRILKIKFDTLACNLHGHHDRILLLRMKTCSCYEATCTKTICQF